MKRVTGIGGIFFKSPNRAELFAWYERHLGIERSPDSPADSPSATFEWREAQDSEILRFTGMTKLMNGTILFFAERVIVQHSSF